MALLAGKLYDPTTAASIALTAMAMTTIDQTNLRLSFNAPANGSVLVRMNGTITGAVTTPSILFGVMAGSTILGRLAPDMTWSGAQAATSFVSAEALFVVTGLTPGSAQVWDAARAVETAVTGAVLRYGGPNDVTVNNAFGGFAFEVWSTA